jgi:hypothetical protein
MTTTAMATYAYGQIDQARAELKVVSKSTTYEGVKTSYRRLVNADGSVVDAPQAGALGTMRRGGGRQPSSTSTVRGWEAMPAFVS